MLRSACCAKRKHCFTTKRWLMLKRTCVLAWIQKELCVCSQEREQRSTPCHTIHTHAHTHTHIYAHAHARLHIHTRTHAHTHTGASATRCLQIQHFALRLPHLVGMTSVQSLHIHTHTHTHAHTRAHTRTHTGASATRCILIQHSHSGDPTSLG